MTLYDSIKKEKCLFTPQIEGNVSLYVCGPTVYDFAHLGHAKSALTFDLLVRILRASGYEVTYVKNITDIDDKIIQKVLTSGQTLQELTAFYTQSYHEDMDALSILRPDIEPKATDFIAPMSAMISTLIEKGFAYQTPDGTVYFDTTKDSHYFSLSHRYNLTQQSHSRLDDAHGKRCESDFAMWKPSKGAQDVAFPSTLGSGRPGWHIECSAMIDAVFKPQGAYSVDIHGGGADLLFPHHENEAAQSRCATGKELAKYWIHNGFVTINGEKMSKSLGNSFFLRDALKHYHGEVLRFYLLSSHYRADFNFSEEDLLSSKKRLDKLFRLKKRLYGLSVSTQETAFSKALIEALSDDLNSSKALSLIDERIALANEQLDNAPKDKALKNAIISDLHTVQNLLGVGIDDAYRYFQFGLSQPQVTRISALIEARTQAKTLKDFAQADAIRATLLEEGISIMDTPQGTKWEKL